MIIRYNLMQNNLWKKKYLGYLTFTKQMCGADFINKMSNYEFNMDVQDKTECYSVKQKCAKSDTGVTVQF